MKVERLDFRVFKEGMEIEPAVRAKIFMPNGKSEADSAPPPPPPTYNEEDLKASEREGFKKGFVDGVKDGRAQAENEQAEVDRNLVAMLEQFVQSVSPLFTHYRAMVMQLQQDMPKAALAIARKVASDALDQNAETVISNMVATCCETMISEPELTITAHESMGDTLERKLKAMSAKFPAATHIVILRDPAMPKTDCRIEWKHGSMERMTSGLWKQIETITGNMSTIAARETTQAMQVLETELKPNETPSSTKE